MYMKKLGQIKIKCEHQLILKKKSPCQNIENFNLMMYGVNAMLHQLFQNLASIVSESNYGVVLHRIVFLGNIGEYFWF